jgi:hypothetical protein
VSLILAVDHPNLEPVRFKNGRRGYRLEEPFAYRWERVSGGVLYERELRFPVGFLSDGASVPRVLWSCSGLTPDGLIRLPALVHDGLYLHRGRIPAGWLYERPKSEPTLGWAEAPESVRTYSRDSADRVFGILMLLCGMEWGEALLAYRAVRCNVFAWRKPVKPLELAEEEL